MELRSNTRALHLSAALIKQRGLQHSKQLMLQRQCKATRSSQLRRLDACKAMETQV